MSKVLSGSNFGPSILASLLSLLASASLATAQDPRDVPGGPPGAGFPGGPGGPGGARETKLIAQFDQNGDGKLDGTERAAAREWIKKQPRRGPGGRGPGGGGPGGGRMPFGEPEPAAPRGEPKHVAPKDVPAYPDRPLYDASIVRTIFLVFPQQDWFEELADFYRSDVALPATMIVDGKEYRDVGVGFRGNSSYFGVQGKKKSFAIDVDASDPKQKLHGFGSLNLLNCHEDPSYLRETLHAFIARKFTHALQANVVQLVVNGESWGLYANVEQFDKDFLDAEYGTRKGVRWKAPANPRGGAGLAWLGDEREAYQRAYELKTAVDDENAAWDRLIGLCRALNETPESELERELPKLLDVDAAMWFLAVDAATLDGDGYASRASDFVLWEGPDGRFRVLPYDSNEVLGAGMRGGRRPGGAPPQGEPRPQDGPRPEGGPGQGPRGPGRGPGGMMGGASPTSSPLAILDAPNRPLARLLRVPAWRAAYLAHLHAIAEQVLDWSVIGAFAEDLHGKLEPFARDDDKSLYGHDAFTRSLETLRRTIETRRKTILEHECMRGPWPELSEPQAKAVLRDGDQAVLEVDARIGGDAKPGAVLLHFALSRRGPFTAIPMHDDGKHGDGAADDGVFGATSEPYDADQDVHWYIEARSAAETPVTTFSPAGASGRPATVASPKARTPRR